MAAISLTHRLKASMTAYLAHYDLSLESLAEKIDVPYMFLCRLSEGSARSCSYYHALQIFAQTEPEQVRWLLNEYFPELSHELNTPIELLSRHSATALREGADQQTGNQMIMQSLLHYRLYAWILAGTSLQGVQIKFGEEGLAMLEEFLDARLVIELSDGRLLACSEEIIPKNRAELLRQISLHTQLIDLNTEEAWLWTRMTHLNPAAATQVRNIIAEARDKIWEIVADPANKGPLPLQLTILSDLVK